MRRDKLMERMIHLYGLENPIVVDFCRLCDTLAVNDWNDKVLQIVVEAHEADPQIFSED